HERPRREPRTTAAGNAKRGRPVADLPRSRVGCALLGQAVTGRGGEDVLLTLADHHVDAVTLHRRGAWFAADDHLGVVLAGAASLGVPSVGQLAVDERVRAELLDQVDVDRERTVGALGDHVQGLRAEAEGDLTLVR